MSSVVAYWNTLEQFKKNTALYAGEEKVSYAQLDRLVTQRSDALSMAMPGSRALAILLMDNSVASVANYLACLRANVAALLIPAKVVPALLSQYITRLSPNLLIDDDRDVWLHTSPINLDERLALLLTTSGSTGAGKCVALSGKNIVSNTASIVGYLPLIEEDKALLSMPISYSYGLSVLNTHLAVGASIVLSSLSPFDKAFWTMLSEEQITSLSGVPVWYKMLLRMKFTQRELPSLRYFTQAGGPLSEVDSIMLAQYAKQTEKQFFKMYGQTEATARIAYSETHQILHKPEVIGQSIPGGVLKLDIQSSSSEGQGELLYQGPNVMLGYADNQQALSKFHQIPWLATGDIAQSDTDGDYRIVGRKKRFIKVAGERVNLDAIERLLADSGVEARCVGHDDKLVCFVLEADKEALQKNLKSFVFIPARFTSVKTVSNWPLLENGKVNYSVLQENIYDPGAVNG